MFTVKSLMTRANPIYIVCSASNKLIFVSLDSVEQYQSISEEKRLPSRSQMIWATFLPDSATMGRPPPGATYWSTM